MLALTPNPKKKTVPSLDVSPFWDPNKGFQKQILVTVTQYGHIIPSVMFMHPWQVCVHVK